VTCRPSSVANSSTATTWCCCEYGGQQAAATRRAAAGAALLAEVTHAGSAWALTPGLALVGFGIGAVLVPLSATVLGGVDPVQAGSAAGVLTTAQQVGGAVGVALSGVLFFASGAVVHAFVVCLVVLAVCAVGTAWLARLVRPAGPDNSGRNLAR
jgi:MFS family permease